jgi:hypothetical protein
MTNLLHLPTLMFPSFAARIEHDGEKATIFDVVRKKHVALTPEEWVRQSCMHWLFSQHYPQGRCSIERRIDSSGMRCDLLFSDKFLKPFLLVECKAPAISVSDITLRQTVWYNLTLQAPYMLLTNGLVAYCAKTERDGTLEMLDHIPPYPLHLP